MNKYILFFSVAIILILLGLTGCFEDETKNDNNDNNIDEKVNGNNTELTPTESTFIGFWYNVENQDEQWRFCDNGSYLYKNEEIDAITREPYLLSVWSTYYLEDSVICLKDQDAPQDQPAICYNYDFSQNNTILSFYSDEVLLFTLTRLE